MSVEGRSLENHKKGSSDSMADCFGLKMFNGGEA